MKKMKVVVSFIDVYKLKTDIKFDIKIKIKNLLFL